MKKYFEPEIEILFSLQAEVSCLIASQEGSGDGDDWSDMIKP